MRILFFPLSNVLGHLLRSFALAEEFDMEGHEVYLATNGSYPSLEKLLAPGINLVFTPEISPEITRSFGPIQSYEEGDANDRLNLDTLKIDHSEQDQRRDRLKEMLDRDKEIIKELDPEVIITDYRFTSPLLEHHIHQRVFHISHLLGIPSLCRRAVGQYFSPLDSGHILVPGIESIEYAMHERKDLDVCGQINMCGIFRWQGWSRLELKNTVPPASQVFLFFGSTGGSERSLPYFLENIPECYTVSVIASETNVHEILQKRKRTFITSRGALPNFLRRSKIIFCHGGHGTVMECIFHQTPMAIFPKNIEQLEIGRCIEKLGLGFLIRCPIDQLSPTELSQIIEKLLGSSRIKANLEQYSHLLRSHNGPARAVSAVLRNHVD